VPETRPASSRSLVVSDSTLLKSLVFSTSMKGNNGFPTRTRDPSHSYEHTPAARFAVNSRRRNDMASVATVWLQMEAIMVP